MDLNQPYPPQGQVYPLRTKHILLQTKHSYPPQGQTYPPPSYDFQPQPTATTTNTTVVTSPPAEDHSGMAICALIFSIFTLLCCGSSLLCLTCIIPALILAIVALTTKGNSQKSNAGISIGLNVAVVVCSVVFLVIFIPAYVLSAASAASSTYRYWGAKGQVSGYSMWYCGLLMSMPPPC